MRKLTTEQKEAMLEGRKKAKECCGLIFTIKKNVEIHSDKYQYILKKGFDETYFTSLEDLFFDLFREEVKIKLVRNQKKDMEEIVKIHKSVAKELKSIFRGIERSKIVV